MYITKQNWRREYTQTFTCLKHLFWIISSLANLIVIKIQALSSTGENEGEKMRVWNREITFVKQQGGEIVGKC